MPTQEKTKPAIIKTTLVAMGSACARDHGSLDQLSGALNVTALWRETSKKIGHFIFQVNAVRSRRVIVTMMTFKLDKKLCASRELETSMSGSSLVTAEIP